MKMGPRVCLLPIIAIIFLAASSAQAESYRAQVKSQAKSALEGLSPIQRQIEAGKKPCWMGANTVLDLKVTGLSDSARSSGIQLGDRLLKVNGEPLTIDNRTEKLGQYRPGDKLAVEVERGGQIVTVDFVCLDGSKAFQAFYEMLQLAAKGRWQQCVDQSYNVDRAYGLATANVAFQRLNCSEARRCGSFGCGAPSLQDANLIYEARRIAIEEALVADIVDQVRGDVLSTISMLEGVGYTRLARDLESKLNAATAVSKAPVAQPAPSVAPSESYGTCFAVSDSQVLTSHHVVSGASMVTVRFHDGREVGAIVDQQSQSTDLALLRVNGKAPAALPLAPMRSLDVGEEVFTVGFPVTQILGSDAKFTEGSVSSLSGIQGDSSFFQMSVPIQPGNSGGPVVNMKGEVVGVVASTAAVEAFYALSGSLPQSVNWAAKADYARLMFEPPNIEWRAKDRSQAIERAKLAVCQVKAVSN